MKKSSGCAVLGAGLLNKEQGDPPINAPEPSLERGGAAGGKREAEKGVKGGLPPGEGGSCRPGVRSAGLLRLLGLSR